MPAFWVPLVRADCMPETPSLQEQMELSPMVLRLIPTPPSSGATKTLPCSIEIYDVDAQGYLLEEEGFPSYTILEVFQQDWSQIVLTTPSTTTSTTTTANNDNSRNILDEKNVTTTSTEAVKNTNNQPNLNLLQPGMTIAIVHDTDTGFYKDLPVSLVNTTATPSDAETSGFLAFLTPYRYCVEPQVEGANFAAASLQAKPYEEHDIMIGATTTATEDQSASLVQENPFLLHQCVTVNQPYASLSNKDIQFLQSQPGYIPATAVSMDTTTPPTDAVLDEEIDPEQEGGKDDKNTNEPAPGEDEGDDDHWNAGLEFDELSIYNPNTTTTSGHNDTTMMNNNVTTELENDGDEETTETPAALPIEDDAAGTNQQDGGVLVDPTDVVLVEDIDTANDDNDDGNGDDAESEEDDDEADLDGQADDESSTEAAPAATSSGYRMAGTTTSVVVVATWVVWSGVGGYLYLAS